MQPITTNLQASGLSFRGNEILLDNGEHYTIEELRFLRWELNQWRRLALSLQRDLDKSGMENAVVFGMEELRQIRAILRLLDDKLPGLKIHATG